MNQRTPPHFCRILLLGPETGQQEQTSEPLFSLQNTWPCTQPNAPKFSPDNVQECGLSAIGVRCQTFASTVTNVPVHTPSTMGPELG